MSDLLLQLDQLSCERDDMALFPAQTVGLYAGDLVQVAGPNGAGKTTLIRTLAGLFGGYTGTFSWPAYAGRSEDPRQHLLYLGHKAGLRDELTAEENLAWWCAMHGFSASGLRGALSLVGLAGYEDVPSAQMSAGQRRRVMLATLWLAPKQVWLLDEPFTALDVHGVAQVEQRLREHAGSGGLVIYSSHHRLDADVRHIQLGGHASRGEGA